MATEQERNKTIVRRIPLEALNQGKFNVFDEIIASDAVEHSPTPGYPASRDGTKQFMTDFRKAFPDLHYELNDEVAEGDLVVQRTTGSGTMRGPLMGMQPSNKHATWTEMHICRLRNGQIIEHWGEVDQLAMLQQLGFVPAQQPASTSTGSSSSSTSARR